MIVTEVYKDGLVITYSSIGRSIERDGVLYDEAIDPVQLGRTYIETDKPINSWLGQQREETNNE